ncbi:MAG: hypothetical protein ACAF41_33040 [Leptolyngbya sp. BL-A-14]
MIPPALTQKKKWILLSVVMLPFALIGIGAKEQIAQAAPQNAFWTTRRNNSCYNIG